MKSSAKPIAPRYLKLVTVPSCCPFTLISLCMQLALLLFVVRFVFSALMPILYIVQVVSRLSAKASSSCSVSASASVSSVNRRLVIFLPHLLSGLTRVLFNYHASIDLIILRRFEFRICTWQTADWSYSVCRVCLPFHHVLPERPRRAGKQKCRYVMILI